MQERIAQIRRWFITRSPREQVLVLALLAGIVFLAWMPSFFARSSDRAREFQVTGERLAYMRELQALQPSIAASLDELLHRIDPAQTLNGSRLFAELSSIAGKGGLSFSISPPTSQQVDRFQYHQAELLVRKGDYGGLMRLTRDILARSPYLTLNSIQITADPGNPSRLDARLLVSAVEIPPS